MNLTETPTTIQFPPFHYVYIEKVGPFRETAPKAWQTLVQNLDEIARCSKIRSRMSLYKMNPEMIYRAGVTVDAKPENLPPGFQYKEFIGGSYARFTLIGSYSQLPQASGRVHELAAHLTTPRRDDYFIEHYVNDPKITAEKDLITEIMIPLK